MVRGSRQTDVAVRLGVCHEVSNKTNNIDTAKQTNPCFPISRYALFELTLCHICISRPINYIMRWNTISPVGWREVSVCVKIVIWNWWPRWISNATMNNINHAHRLFWAGTLMEEHRTRLRRQATETESTVKQRSKNTCITWFTTGSWLLNDPECGGTSSAPLARWNGTGAWGLTCESYHGNNQLTLAITTGYDVYCELIESNNNEFLEQCY